MTSRRRPATREVRKSVSSPTGLDCGSRCRWCRALFAQTSRTRVGVLDGEPATGEDPGPTARRSQAAGRRRRALDPRCGNERSGVVADERRREAVVGGGIGERPPPLVAVPFLVDLGVVPREAAQHRSAPVVGALSAAARAVFAHTRSGDQIERAGAEPVGGAGERTDRADLDGVAGEVRLERFLGVDADLLQRPAVEHVDEPVARDLVGEAGAARAQHAAFAVEEHLRGDRDGFR